MLRCFFEHNLADVVREACASGLPVAAFPALSRSLRAAGKPLSPKMLTTLLKRCGGAGARGGAAAAEELVADARAAGVQLNAITYTAAANALAAERASPAALWEAMVLEASSGGLEVDGYALVAFAAASLKAREYDFLVSLHDGELVVSKSGGSPAPFLLPDAPASLYAAHPELGTMVVQALGRRKRGADALKAFEATSAKDAQAFATLITALGRSGMAAEALAQLDRMRAAGVRARGPLAYNAAMDACARLAESSPSAHVREDALGLLERAATMMEEDDTRPDAITYNTAMRACVAAGAAARVFPLLDRMYDARVRRDITTYLQVLAACRAERQIDYAIRLVAGMEADGVKPTHWVYDLLMRVCYPERADAVCDAYGRMREGRLLEERFRVLDGERTPFGMPTATLAVLAYGDRGDWRGVLRVMRDVRSYGFAPDEYLCNAAVLSFGKCGQVDLALNTLHAMRGANSLGKCKQVDLALNTLHAMRGANSLGGVGGGGGGFGGDGSCAPGGRAGVGAGGVHAFARVPPSMRGQPPARAPAATVVSYTAAIASCAKNGRMADALALLEAMEREGVEPNAKTYSTLVQQAAEEGDVEAALGALVRMRRAGVEVDEVARGMLLDAFNGPGDMARMLLQAL